MMFFGDYALTLIPWPVVIRLIYARACAYISGKSHGITIDYTRLTGISDALNNTY